jgi:hypothetical protein
MSDRKVARRFSFFKFDGVEVCARDVAKQLFFGTNANEESIHRACEFLRNDLLFALDSGVSFQDYRYTLMGTAQEAYLKLGKELDGSEGYAIAHEHWLETMFDVQVMCLLEVWSFRVFVRNANESTKTEST